MKYYPVKKGIFLQRPNRFIAHVEVDGEEHVCHVKNTGRCRELLLPGCTVYLEEAASPERKTKYDLIAVEKNGRLINMDSQAPNKVFAQWAKEGHFAGELDGIWPEYSFGSSRLDFRLDTKEGPHLVEVKGVTLEDNNRVYFPDAPTERGVRHLEELMLAVRQGYKATAFFVIQMEGVESFSPNDVTHPAFGDALRRAKEVGVEIRAFDCKVGYDSLEINIEVPVVL